LHHVIVRGIEKRQIVDDDKDSKSFVDRMGSLALETDTAIYAWALMGNHAHILLRSGPLGLSKYMKRLLTGYAVFYNRRHGRHGHLFQNRFKSIVVEEDAYFQELVRYIHLNPIRAGIIDSIFKLERYRWCGHSVILGKLKNDWQDMEQGHRSDLTGGGLIRSQGGWAAVKDMLRQGVREKSDERILGSGEFVQQLIQESDIERKRQFSRKENLELAIRYIKRECKDEEVDIKALRAGGRRRIVSRLRNRLIQNMVEDFGISLAETGRQLGVSSSAVAKALDRRNIESS
jgi:REP element-mobilizing transposase RayT